MLNPNFEDEPAFIEFPSSNLSQMKSILSGPSVPLESSKALQENQIFETDVVAASSELDSAKSRRDDQWDVDKHGCWYSFKRWLRGEFNCHIFIFLLCYDKYDFV
ncbi:unnamed protein product [Protopolystoma xenopodis]|uniref:Uncharacterized protein n=1 Tax=Protopolystoma xenopodis TaxID=117903 RepID=A0A448WRM9_9PLAT|nr:unnamed protein product [Protopolystoma xenopodis]